MAAYTLVGVAFGVVATLIIQYFLKADLPTGKRVGAIVLVLIGLVLIGFGLDWAYASTLENEPQSSAMSILMFGGFGVIFGVIGFRLGHVKKDEPQDELQEEA